MKEDFVALTYTLPPAHIFSRHRADTLPKATAKEVRRIGGQLKRYFFKRGFDRSSSFVRDTFEGQWSASNREWFRAITSKNLPTPRREGSEIIVGDGLLILSAHMQMLSHIFDELGCNSVLDVGSGRGNNVIALASLNPMREYYGVELTGSGYERSLEWEKDLKEGPMPLVDIGEDMSAINFSRIHFSQGSATALPFTDKLVDASFTNFVLEQIPHEYQKALSEIRRVTKRYAIFIESFRESLSFADKLDLKNRDQFRFSYRTFEKYGLRPVFFSTKFIKKTKFGSGLLITEIV